MFRKVLVPIAFSLALVATVRSEAIAADDFSIYQARLKREATQLFRAVLSKTGKPNPCTLAAEWMDYPVPEQVAREHLGLTIHGDLSPPHHGTKPAEILDPSGRMRAAFCDDKASDRHREATIAGLQGGTFARETLPRTPGGFVDFTRTEYSFPIFDEGYGKAIIVITVGSSFWSPGANMPAELYIAAVVFRKRNGVWQQMAEEVLGQT